VYSTTSPSPSVNLKTRALAWLSYLTSVISAVTNVRGSLESSGLAMCGHRMCCRRYGDDHRPAMITKADKPVILAHRLGTFLGIQATPERAGLSPPGRPIQDHLQLITLPASAHAAAPSDGAESMIEASVAANGASPVDSQFESIQKPSTAVSFTP
jgi:hypothetical protein